MSLFSYEVRFGPPGGVAHETQSSVSLLSLALDGRIVTPAKLGKAQAEKSSKHRVRVAHRPSSVQVDMTQKDAMISPHWQARL